MPRMTTPDGIGLYYEEAGHGTPIVFAHEFAGDYRSYQLQMRHLGRQHRCIAFNARGYPPSDVPETPAAYSTDIARDDIRALLDDLGIDKAHLLGISMGAASVLQFGIKHPDRVRSLVLGGCGFGADPRTRERDLAAIEAAAQKIEQEGFQKFVHDYARSSLRLQFKDKDPIGWAEFERHLSEHSAKGAVLIYRGVLKTRPAFFAQVDQLRRLRMPILLICGDEDEVCLEPSLFLKRTIMSAALAVIPATGHAVNLENPALFNQTCSEFFSLVDSGHWRSQEPEESRSNPFGFR